ncbi:hypothetical protein LJB82_00185 [Desulfovibrio sp. OttesenSCG-928-M16]|nr:hypothetical protein [Desulfovibrio sp. OttesenSCG-928-M16]
MLRIYEKKSAAPGIKSLKNDKDQAGSRKKVRVRHGRLTLCGKGSQHQQPDFTAVFVNAFRRKKMYLYHKAGLGKLFFEYFLYFFWPLGKAEFFRLARRESFLKGGVDSLVLPPFKKGEQRSKTE